MMEYTGNIYHSSMNSYMNWAYESESEEVEETPEPCPPQDVEKTGL